MDRLIGLRVKKKNGCCVQSTYIDTDRHTHTFTHTREQGLMVLAQAKLHRVTKCEATRRRGEFFFQFSSSRREGCCSNTVVSDVTLPDSESGSVAKPNEDVRSVFPVLLVRTLSLPPFINKAPVTNGTRVL